MGKVKLGEVCKVQGGYAFKSKEFLKNNIPIIRIGNIKDNEVEIDYNVCYTEEFLNKHPEFEIKYGDILIAMSGATVGKIGKYQNNSKALLNQRVGKFVVTKKLEKRYLYFLLRSPLFEKFILNNAFGCAQPNISGKKIEEFEFYNYDNIEQLEIANKLDKVQEIIDIRKKQIQQLDELIKSQFVEMFENKNYEKLSGKELFSFSSGKFLESSKRLENGVPVYGGNGVVWYTDEPLIDFNTIVIGRVGAYCGNVKLIKKPVWITDNAIFIKQFKKDVYNIDFLYYMMELVDFSRFAQFSGQPKITQKPLEEFNYVVPPIELQNQFADIVKQIDKQKFEIQRSLEETQELQESLMNKYFG